MTPTPSPNAPIDLPQALREIERLRIQLAESERIRDAYWQTIHKNLPPLPPELEFLEKNLDELLVGSVPMDAALCDLFAGEDRE